jgi:hypothetical protein
MLSEEDQRQLVEAQILISQSLSGINSTLQKINDQNILHQEATKQEHNGIVLKLQELSMKYWWLILILAGALIVLAGAEKIFSFLPG